jgi:hypothetical protein
MVSAGTLGAAYATVDDVAAQLAGMVEALMAGQVVDPQYPLYWRVAINDSVARSLDVTVDSSVRDTAVPGDGAEVDTLVADAGGDTLVDTSVADTATPDTAPVSVGCDGSTALFCEDWDKSTTFQAGFDWNNLDPTATLALESTGRSAPQSLLAGITPGDAGVVTADLGKNIIAPTADATLRVDAWIQLETLALPTATGGAFLFKLERGGVGDGVTFSINDAGLYVDRIGNTYGFYAITYKPAVSTWFHVRMDIKLHTTAGVIKLWIDDMVTPKLDVSGVSTAKADSTTRELIVGLYAQSATGAFRARYDDVSVGVP